MGFSAEWLALREPADHAARDTGLLRRALRAAGPDPVILDLGCGTGATVRALAPHLPKGAVWRLVDNDDDLLNRAAHAADTAGASAQTNCLDLNDLEALPLEGVTLVTASALFDLVSEQWLRALAARIKTPIYAALSYDGEMSWEPADPVDDPVTAAFNRHQTGDKGFGPALGPAAVAQGAAIFRDAGFEVAQADSPWTLGPQEATLQRALVAGIAEAASEAAPSEAAAARVRDWGAMRNARAPDTYCRIGHGDMLAIPRGTVRETDHGTD